MQQLVKQLRTVQDEMLVMTEQLVDEFSQDLPAGTVIRCVARCRRRMVRTGVRAGLVPATEAAARVRLRALVTTLAA